VRERDAWRLFVGKPPRAHASVLVSADCAWRPFPNDRSRADSVRLEGDRALGEPFLGALAAMA
jgi:hypothetical protein